MLSQFLSSIPNQFDIYIVITFVGIAHSTEEIGIARKFPPRSKSNVSVLILEF